jgi:alpha-tubulin suppressor-like RCC1 family protein
MIATLRWLPRRPRCALRRICAVALPGLLLAAAPVAAFSAPIGAQSDPAEAPVDTQPVPAVAPLRQVEVGQDHACVVDAEGRVHCWGADTSGQVSDWGRMKYRSERFTSVSAGSYFTCGIRTDGAVMCWGHPELEDGSHSESDHRDWDTWVDFPSADYDGWVNTPPERVRFRHDSLSVGNFHACAIRTSGELACWGKAGSARLVIPTDDGEVITDWIMVEAGWAHACAIRAGGSVVCFGRSTHNRSDGPTGEGPFIDVTLGTYNGCALAGDGSVECWGGHAGLAEYNAIINTPPEGVRFTDIEMSVTEFYSCGLAEDGTVHCWGIVQNAAHVPRLAPTSGSFASISVGSSNSCALDATAELTCWGDSSSLLTPPSGTFTQTSGGAGFNCALRSDGTISCWGGFNTGGQLDSPSGTFTLVSSGLDHSCAIKTDGTVACWGGVSGDPPVRHAAAVAPPGRFATLDAGADLTCGIKLNGRLECWGDDGYDRLEEPGGVFSRVAVGATHVCAIGSDDQAICWGQTIFFDREGDGNPDDIDGKGNHTTTTPPSGGHRYTDISAGEGHTCAIREDAKAVCWGYHADGRNQVRGFADSQGFSAWEYADIATGGPNNCGIRSSDGSLACWNHEKPQYWPGSEILAMEGFKSLGAGSTHMCGIDRNDELLCWGSDGIIPFPTKLRAAPATPAEVRIVARWVSGGRVEVALEETSQQGDRWVRTQLERRFLPAGAKVGRWLTSGAAEVGEGDATAEVRITARRVAGGRVELALQVRADDGSWSQRLLPRLRFLPADSEPDRWRNSSALTAEAP